MGEIEEHLFAMPFGLPGQRDARLLKYLEEDDWASAVTLLRGVVTPATTNAKWLLLLAYARFRDAVEIMVDEVGPASREALDLITRAMTQGAKIEAVAPLKDAVESALDEVTREELRLTVAYEAGVDQMNDDDLEAIAVLLWKKAPRKAAELFDMVATRVKGARALIASTHAAVCLSEAGAPEAHARLEQAVREDWTQEGRRDAASVLESAETALLLDAQGSAFDTAWQSAETRGMTLEFPFPSVWPNQERLLEKCVRIGDMKRARRLSEVIESERAECSEHLRELMRQARMASA